MQEIYKKSEAQSEMDVLVIAAHPDDAELAAGGTIAKLTNEGYSVAIADLTRGEQGTRGTPEIRLTESRKAAEILGVDYRINLLAHDGNIEQSMDNIIKVIQVIRRFKPKAVLMNPGFERHPDHEAVHRLVRTAMFKSGLQKIPTEFDGKLQERWRIRKMFSFMMSYPFETKPDFYVDISDTFAAKMESIKAYVSQVYIPGISREDEPVTRLSRPEFLEEIESRAIYFGTLIGARYAEAFSAVEPIGLSSISKLL